MTPIESLKALLGFPTTIKDVLQNSAIEMQFLFLLNEYRASLGVPAVGISSGLTLAATGKAKDMVKLDYFSHTCPGRPSHPADFSPWELMAGAGYTANTFKGEILAKYYGSALTVFNGWKASPGHNAIMIDPNYKAIGIAAHADANGYLLWAGEFGGEA